jgi:hypothetical protein
MKTLKLKMVIVLTICVVSLTKAVSVPENGMTINYLSSLQRATSFFGSGITSLPGETDWELCYESDQIYIYERWIPVTTERNTMERKGEMYVNCSMEQALKMINDYENVKTWNQNVKVCSLLKKNNVSNWITYTLFDLPWPFQNRDVVSEYNVQSVSPGWFVVVKINSVDDLVKQKDGITRITKYKATWSVKKITNQKCWICFSASCDNPPAVSRKIQDPILRKSFHKNLLSLRTALE